MFRQEEIPVKVVYWFRSLGIFSSKSKVSLIKNDQVLNTYYASEKDACNGGFGLVRFFKDEQGQELAVKSPIGVVTNPYNFDGVNLISSQVFFKKVYPNHISSIHTYPGTYRQVMPKFPGMTLDKALKNPTQAYFIDVVLAVAKELKRLHGLDIVHGDIKGKNIIVNGADIYFIDFDFSYYADKKATVTSYTHKECVYWAPERTNRCDEIDANIAQDIYSFAMLFDEKYFNRDFLEDHIGYYLYLYGEKAKLEPEKRPSLDLFISAFEGFKMQAEMATLDINDSVKRTM
ncbi:MAG: serine/threonine-protein kinase [Gammaproteobacteria bacterium]